MREEELAEVLSYGTRTAVVQQAYLYRQVEWLAIYT